MKPRSTSKFHLRQWLTQKGLEHLATDFESHAVTLDQLPDLTEQHMAEMGVLIGDRVRLQHAIASLAKENILHSAAQLRQVTIMFCDLVGSTALSEQMPPEAYLELLRSYQRVIRDVQSSYGGLVNRYVGDGVMVIYGYPRAQEDAPDRAIAAALKTIEAVNAIETSSGISLQSRIGISTGEAAISEVNDELVSERLSFAGSQTNFAARLQSYAAPDQVVIAQNTLSLSRSALRIKPLKNLNLKGFSGVVTAYIVEEIQSRHARSGASDRYTGKESTPLVARRDELSLLQNALKSAEEGQGQFVLISGEPGIGKTRLIREFNNTNGEDSHSKLHVIQCQCRQLYANTAFYPLTESLASALGVDLTGLSKEELAAQLKRKLNIENNIAEVFGDLVSTSLPTGDFDRADLDSREIYQALFGYFNRILAEKPVVVLIEDIHWADPTSLKFVARLVEWVMDKSVLVVVSSRSEFQPEFATNTNVSWLRLSKLSKSESMQIVERQPHAEQMSDRVKDLVIQRANGVPLYLEELSRNFDGGIEQERNSASIPVSLRDLLMAKIDLLDQLAELVQIAAVFGGPFTEKQLVSVSTLDSMFVRRGLEDLVSKNIFVYSLRVGMETYEFSHELLRDAAYGSMLDATKRSLHKAVANELYQFDNIAESEFEFAARHCELAGEFFRAISLWELAGDYAYKQSAHLEAEIAYKHAIHLLESKNSETWHKSADEDGYPDHRLRLYLRLSSQLVAGYGNGSKETKSYFKKARELAASLSRRSEEFQALYGLQGCTMVQGDMYASKILCDDLLRLAVDLNTTDARVAGLRALGWCLAVMGRFEPAKQHLDESVRLYSARDFAVANSGLISNPLVLAKCNLALVECFGGSPAEACQLAEESVEYAKAIGNKHGLAFALAISSIVYQALDDVVKCDQTSTELHTLSRESYFPYWKAWANVMKGWGSAIQGDEKGFTLLERGLMNYTETGASMFHPYFETLYANCYLANGNSVSAREKLNSAIVLSDVTGVKFHAGQIDRLKDTLEKGVDSSFAV